MLHVIAQVFVPVENQSAYLELGRDMVDLTRKEEGCHEFVLTASTVPGRETEFLYIERWESRAHLDAHLNSEHFLRISPEMNKLVSKAGEVWFMGDAYVVHAGE